MPDEERGAMSEAWDTAIRKDETCTRSGVLRWAYEFGWQSRGAYDRSALAAAEQQTEKLRAALEEIRRGALTIVGASEAYGETESAHLWNEIAALAEGALWPLVAAPVEPAAGGTDRHEPWCPAAGGECCCDAPPFGHHD